MVIRTYINIWKKEGIAYVSELSQYSFGEPEEDQEL
jgi:hypothetical protein